MDVLKIFIGDKFYRKINDEIEIIRLVKMRNEDKLVFSTKDTKQELVMTRKELLDKYKKLRSHAKLAFSIVEVENEVKDVMVTLYRPQDEKSGLPYCVCRQGIIDFLNPTDEKSPQQFVGISISKDTIPSNVNYYKVLGCTNVIYSQTISVYAYDKFEELFSLIPERFITKADNVLKQRKEEMKNTRLVGWCSTLRELLIQNQFMYDFRKAFNIELFPEEVVIEEDNKLNTNQVIQLEDIFKTEIFDTLVVLYDEKINIKAIERDYLLISDTKDDVYIVAYDKGEYLNRAYKDVFKNIRNIKPSELKNV